MAFTRRDFLKYMGIGTAGIASMLALSACGEAEDDAADDAATTAETAEAADAAFADNVEDAVVIDESRKTTANSDERFPSLCWGNSSHPDQLNPNAKMNGSFIYYIAEALVDQGDSLKEEEWVSRIAKEWGYVDETHYQCTIYENIVDWDNNPLTASDIKFVYDTYLASGMANADYKYIDHIDVLDSFTFQFVFGKRVDSLTSLWNIMSRYLYTQKAYETHDFASDPVYTGPYHISEFATGTRIVLEANSSYWQDDDKISPYAKRNVDTLQLDVVSEYAMQLITFEEGSNIMLEIDADDVQSFLPGGKYDGQYNLVKRLEGSNFRLLYNLSGNSIMSDKNMRLACALAINRDDMAYAMGDGIYFPCTVNAAPSLPDYQPEWDNYECEVTKYDLDLAKEYLAKTAYNGETIIIMASASGKHKKMAELTQTFLNYLVFTTELAFYENAVIDTYRNDPTYWDLYVDINDSKASAADMWVKKFGTTYGGLEGYAFCFVQDAEFDEMLYKCCDPETYSVELLNEINDYMLQNVYCKPLVYAVVYQAFQKSVANVVYARSKQWVQWNSCDYYLD